MSAGHYNEIVDPAKVEIYPQMGTGYFTLQGGFRVGFNNASSTSIVPRLTLVDDINNAKNQAAQRGKWLRLQFTADYRNYVTDLHVLSTNEDPPLTPAPAPTP